MLSMSLSPISLTSTAIDAMSSSVQPTAANTRLVITKDKASTGNLIKHAKLCWGEEAWNATNECKDATEARETITKPMSKTGSITAIFKWLWKGKVMYLHHMHMKTKYILCPLIQIYLFMNNQSWNCSLGVRKSSALQDCWRSRVPQSNKNKKTRILHTFCIYCLLRCEVGVCMHTGSDWKAATSKTSKSAQQYWPRNWSTCRSMKVTLAL